MNDLIAEQLPGRSSGAAIGTELAALRAQLVEQIHENGRLADKLNKATTELAAERGFLANARARADQAEIDRDEWRAAADRWKRWAEATMVRGALQDALHADVAPQKGDDAQTFDDLLAGHLRASNGHTEEVGCMRQIGYDELRFQIASQNDHAISNCRHCCVAALFACVTCWAAVIALAVWS